MQAWFGLSMLRGSFAAELLLPSSFDVMAVEPRPRVVGLVYDPVHEVGLANPLITELADKLQHSPLLPFTAGGIRSLLLRLCDASDHRLEGGIPESAGFRFSESLGEHCLGNSMDIAGLLSALDALSGRACLVFSAACAVVEPGYGSTLQPVSRISEKLEAFLREYGTGSLLVTSKGCRESEPFHEHFSEVWCVDSLTDLAAKVAQISAVREELVRSAPLSPRQTNAILGELNHLIEHEHNYCRGIGLCERIQTIGFDGDVSPLKQLKVLRRYADALRHSGMFKRSLEVVAQMQSLLSACGDILSFEDEVRHAVANAAALIDGCDFEAAAMCLSSSCELCNREPKSVSAQLRIEVMNTLGRVLVVQNADGWQELFERSILLQRILDPQNVRRTETYMIQGFLRTGRVAEAESIVLRHEADSSVDQFSRSFTTFYRCELDRQTGKKSEPIQGGVDLYTIAFALQACARQAGRTVEERLRFFAEAEGVLRRVTNANDGNNILVLIADACSVAYAARENDFEKWNIAIAKLAETVSIVGPAACTHFGCMLDSMSSNPSIDESERLLQRIPYL